jgi:hypothetical protein
MKFFDIVYRHADNPAEQKVCIGIKNGSGFNNEVWSVSQVQSMNGDWRQDADVYYTPAVFQPQTPQRKKQYVEGSSVVWADIDDYEYNEWDKRWLLPPTAVVSSGHGVHLYWALDQQYPGDIIEDLNKRIAAHVGGDNVWDRGRLLRVPGTFNHKAEPVKPVTLVELNPEWVYTPAQLEKAGPQPHLEHGPDTDRSAREYKLTVWMLEHGYDVGLVERIVPYHSSRASENLERWAADLVRITGKHEEKTKSEGFVASDFLTDIAEEVSVKKKERTVRVEKQQNHPRDGMGDAEIEAVGRLFDPAGIFQGIVLQVTLGDQEFKKQASNQDFASRARFLKWLNSISGVLTYSMGDTMVAKLWQILVAEAHDKEAQILLPCFGRHKVGDQYLYAVEANRAIGPDGWVPVYVDVDEPDNIPKPEVELADEDFPVGQLWDKFLFLVFNGQPEKMIKPAAAWTMGSVFREVFYEFGRNYPHLIVTGAKGTGKTTVVREFLFPLLSMSNPALAMPTPFVAIQRVSCTNGWPVWFSEFRQVGNPYIKTHETVFRNAYDNQKTERGRQDQTISGYHQRSPILVDGETTLDDAATRDRFIVVTTDRDYTNTARDVEVAARAFDREHLKLMTGHFIQWSLSVANVFDLYEDNIELMDSMSIQARPKERVAALLTVCDLLDQYLLSIGAKARFSLRVEDVVALVTADNDGDMGEQTIADNFATMVIHNFNNQGFQTEGVFEYDGEQDILWFSLQPMVKVAHWTLGNYSQTFLRNVLKDRYQDYIEPLQQRPDGGKRYGLRLRDMRAKGMDAPMIRLQGYLKAGDYE